MPCTHVKEVGNPPARTEGCEECLKLGQGWVHLRRCMTCGHVGCCDDSVGKHATGHFRQTRHPIITSFEPGEEWGWCYVDEELLDASAIPALEAAYAGART